ncbi:MAG: DUF4423 domain-containing protein, partial [Bdellovibrionales bacterium]|nr:DUF4423 domain-containing protein [Bdellovibrionales bacterium]
INEFRKFILDLSSEQKDLDSIYQLNIQFFPLTEDQ